MKISVCLRQTPLAAWKDIVEVVNSCDRKGTCQLVWLVKVTCVLRQVSYFDDLACSIADSRWDQARQGRVSAR